MRPPGTLLEPLRQPLFRRIWSASLMTNFGLMIQSVGAAWAMTQMTSHPATIALVQSALMAPIMLLSIPAGAVADIFDRRKVALAALGIALAGTAMLTVTAFHNWMTPAILLAFCFMIGSGQALFNPAWQSSVGEQVPARALPAAIMLNGISYNVARTLGPAIGGVIVAVGGAVAAFFANFLFYLPMVLTMIWWRRVPDSAPFPPERFPKAIVLGVRYVALTPVIRTIVLRVFVVGFVGSAIYALLPLVARDQLAGTARTYGFLLGCFGVGAVLGVFLIDRLRVHFSTEGTIGFAAAAMGIGMAVIAVSPSVLLSGTALIAAGTGWTIALTVFNIGVQVAAPSWVLGRALAGFHTATTGGIALGSWIWGTIAGGIGLDSALLIAAAIMLASAALLRRILPVNEPLSDGRELADIVPLAEVDVEISRPGGPIAIELEYRIDPAMSDEFRRLAQELCLVRSRNGARRWSIARDISNARSWIERFHYPTWLDYQRQRGRATLVERALEDRVRGLHSGPDPIRVRRLVECRLPTVRHKVDSTNR